MRLRGYAIVAALVTAQMCAAFGQQAAATPSTSKTPAGITLSFDAQHGQLTASGYAVKSQTTPGPTAVSVSGTINISLTINLVSKTGEHDRISCGAIALGGEVDLSTPVLDGGIETASNFAMVDWKTKTATCTLSIPYEWTLAADPSATAGLIVGFAAASIDHDHWDMTRRSTIQLGGPLPLPPSGTTTTLAFTTAL